MKIGYLYGFNSYPPATGGAVHAYNLTRHLAAHGCEVHVVGDQANPACVSHPADDRGLDAFLRAVEVLYVRVDGRSLRRSALKRRCLDRFAPRPIVWEINAPADERLALFAAPASPPRRAAFPALWRLAGRPAGALLTRRRVAAEEAFRRRVARHVRAATAVSTILQTYAVEDLGIRECAVVPNGSDPELFSPETPHPNPLAGGGASKVVYVGDFRWPWQGIELVRTLARRALDERRDIDFVIVTNSPVGGLVPERNVRVCAGVGYFELPAYLAHADVCLCLYRDYGWSRYGFYGSPIKLFDYMAAAKPVVASKQGQIAEVIDDGRDGLLAGSLEDAYRLVVYCLEHRAEARRLGERAREKVVAFYNWARAAQATLEVIRAVREPTPA